MKGARWLAGVASVVALAMGCHRIFPFDQIDAAPVDAADNLLDARPGDLFVPSELSVDAPASDALVPDGPVPDAAPDAPAPDMEPDAPPPDMEPSVCGNGIVEPGEVCDDGDTDGTDLCAADCKAINPLCTGDTIPSASAEGLRTVEPASDIVPLCDGWVLLGNTVKNAVQLRNILSGKLFHSINLPGAPGDLELDPQTGKLHVALAGSSSLYTVDLSTGQLSPPVVLSQPAKSVTVGTGGYLLATLASASSIASPLVYVSPAGAVTAANKTVYPLLTFDHKRGHLIAGQLGNSPSSLAIHKFTTSPLDITLVSTLSAGTNGRELALSPDNDHLAFVCGGGNAGAPTNYSIADYHADDPSNVFGYWTLGAYPESAAFDPGSQKLVATNRTDIVVYSVVTHTSLMTKTPKDTTCGAALTVSRVAYSRGGKLFYGYFNCPSGTSARVYWAVSP